MLVLLDLDMVQALLAPLICKSLEKFGRLVLVVPSGYSHGSKYDSFGLFGSGFVANTFSCRFLDDLFSWRASQHAMQFFVVAVCEMISCKSSVLEDLHYSAMVKYVLVYLFRK